MKLFLGCSNNNQKIGLECDYHINNGITIIGKNNVYTNTLADLLALQIAQQGDFVFFIDRPGNTIINNMNDYGFDESTIEKMVYESNSINALSYDKDKHEIYIDNDQRHIFSLCNDDLETAISDFLSFKENVKEEWVILVLHSASELERKVDKPFYNLMKRMNNLKIIVISVYESLDDLKGVHNSIVNKADIKMLFTVPESDDIEKYAVANRIKSSSEFRDIILDQEDYEFIMIGKLEDADGEYSNGRFIQIGIPDDEDIVNLIS